MILNKQVMANNNSLLVSLDLLYSIALAVGVMGYVFLICVWYSSRISTDSYNRMKFYKDIISHRANISTGWFLRNFVKVYMISNLVATFVFVLSFVIEVALPTSNTNIWSYNNIRCFETYIFLCLATHSNRSSDNFSNNLWKKNYK